AAVEENVFTALSHYSCRCCTASNRGANCCAVTTTCNNTNNCTDSTGSTDLTYVVLGGIAPAHATFGINRNFAAVTSRNDFDKVGMKLRGGVVGKPDRLKSQL